MFAAHGTLGHIIEAARNYKRQWEEVESVYEGPSALGDGLPLGVNWPGDFEPFGFNSGWATQLGWPALKIAIESEIGPMDGRDAYRHVVSARAMICRLQNCGEHDANNMRLDEAARVLSRQANPSHTESAIRERVFPPPPDWLVGPRADSVESLHAEADSCRRALLETTDESRLLIVHSGKLVRRMWDTMRELGGSVPKSRDDVKDCGLPAACADEIAGQKRRREVLDALDDVVIWCEQRSAQLRPAETNASAAADPDAKEIGKWIIRPGEASFDGGRFFDVDGAVRELLIRLAEANERTVSNGQLKFTCGNDMMEDETLRNHVFRLNSILKDELGLSTNPVTAVVGAYRLRVPQPSQRTTTTQKKTKRTSNARRDRG